MWDTDGDGLSDGQELDPALATDPNDADTDDDGLPDGYEDATVGFSPNDDDSNDDGIPDGQEDTDGDRLADAAEISVHFTDPKNADTDGDGLPDGYEIDNALDPKHEDSDRNGTIDGDEDSDDDGLNDAAEVVVYKTNPDSGDSDGDGLTDFEEVTEHSTDPNLKDTDRDGLSDLEEIEAKTNPLSPDTDGDGLFDGDELKYCGTDPTRRLTAGRQLTDSIEDCDFPPGHPLGPAVKETPVPPTATPSGPGGAAEGTPGPKDTSSPEPTAAAPTRTPAPDEKSVPPVAAGGTEGGPGGPTLEPGQSPSTAGASWPPPTEAPLTEVARAESEGFIERFWWLLAIVVGLAIAVGGILVVLLLSRRDGGPRAPRTGDYPSTGPAAPVGPAGPTDAQRGRMQRLVESLRSSGLRVEDIERAVSGVSASSAPLLQAALEELAEQHESPPDATRGYQDEVQRTIGYCQREINDAVARRAPLSLLDMANGLLTKATTGPQHQAAQEVAEVVLEAVYWQYLPRRTRNRDGS